MFSVICKIFGFLLKLFVKVVRAIADAVRVIGTAVVDVLGDLVTSVIGKPGSLLLWLGLGIGAYFLFTKEDDKPKLVVTGGKHENSRLSSV